MWRLHGKLPHKQGAAHFLSTADDQAGADGSGRNGPAGPRAVGVPHLRRGAASRCPVQIDFPEFARGYRELARNEGNVPQLSHHGTLQAIASLQTRNISQKRTDWAKEVGKFQATGDDFYFVGCAPYFDATLKYGPTSLETARNVLKLLNRMGIEPAMSDDERCCGHDALWSGDEATFRKLASLNLEMIAGFGRKDGHFQLPGRIHDLQDGNSEILRRLALRGDPYLRVPGPRASRSGTYLQAGRKRRRGTVTYQDPCRLGRKGGNLRAAPRPFEAHSRSASSKRCA